MSYHQDDDEVAVARRRSGGRVRARGNMRRLVAATAPIVLLLASACAGGESGDSSESATASTATTAAAATTGQYASLVARNEFGDILDYFLADCFLYTSPFCADPVESVDSHATEFADALRSAPVTIGEPPAEIDTLVSDTIDAAEAVSEATSAWLEKCSDADIVPNMDQACTDSWDSMRAISDDLRHTVSGWDPYL